MQCNGIRFLRPDPFLPLNLVPFRPDPFDLPNQIEYPHFDDLVKLMQSYEETVKEHADLITQAEKLDIPVIKD